jgi:hypothetical protein
MASFWKWTALVEANGQQGSISGDTQGPDHATEDNIRKGVEHGLSQAYPRGYKVLNFMATRLG